MLKNLSKVGKMEGILASADVTPYL